MEVRPPQTEDEFARYFDLRFRVLRAPWGGERGCERDELEDTADHALLLDDNGEAIAVGRLQFNSPDEAQVRYVAVAEDARGSGSGRKIMVYLEELARQRDATLVVLNARDEVVPFYLKLGFEVVGEGPTMFDTVRHSRMAKRLR
jgi:predicted GNAT family N-acyltransferase